MNILKKIKLPLVSSCLSVIILICFLSTNSHAQTTNSKKSFAQQVKKIDSIVLKKVTVAFQAIQFRKQKKSNEALTTKKEVEKKEIIRNKNIELEKPKKVRVKKIRTNSTIPIPVGFSDFDETIRDFQLLGKITPDNANSTRPFYLNNHLSYDSLLKLIDPKFEYKGTLINKKHFNTTLLPVNVLQKYNSDHPFGWNDGALNFSKGYQIQAGGGIYARFYNLHLTLRPEYFQTARDSFQTSSDWGQVTQSVKQFGLGQSSLRLDLGPVSVGASTQNLWFGPGQYSSLLMSNNAQGFKHFSINTTRPLKTGIGNFQFQLIGGVLTQNATQVFENKNLKVSSISDNTRYINLLNLSYEAPFLKNVYFNFQRAFQTYSLQEKSKNFLQDYLPVFRAIFTPGYNDTKQGIDQVMSFGTRWVAPKNNAEVYFEYGYNDAKGNLRDLTLDMSHASAYTFGFKKLHYLRNATFLSFGAEITRMAPTPSYLNRYAGNWYEHGEVTEGYTNQNQIMGVGNGWGNNMQTVQLSWNKKWSKIGILFHHLAQNPMYMINTDVYTLGLRQNFWDDYAYGIQTRYKVNKIIFSGNLSLVESKNYLWKDGNNKLNFYAFINTIYLW